jgi:hypothetical protein
MLKIFIINPTYQYVYECIVKIVYYSYEDGNKKFNHHHFSQRFSIRQNFPGLIYFYNWSGLDIYAGFESRGSWFPLSTDNIFEIIHKCFPLWRVLKSAVLWFRDILIWVRIRILFRILLFSSVTFKIIISFFYLITF